MLAPPLARHCPAPLASEMSEAAVRPAAAARPRAPKRPRSVPEAAAPAAATETTADRRWALSSKRFVTVREFRGQVLTDVREFFDKGGQLFPGKKGISLSIEQLRELAAALPDILEEAEARATKLA